MSTGAPPTSKYLAIYLNDHLMGATVGVELVKRIAGEHAGTPLGRLGAELVAEIGEDRQALLEILEQVGAGPDRAKVAAGWIAERAGRLKPNGQLRGSSPLTPLIELEGLSAGIEGKRMLWLSLAADEAVAERVGRERLDRLIARAEDQRGRVEALRRDIARQAFSPG